MIPQLIHQTSKTSDLPTKWIAYQQKVRKLHPGWTYKLWTDEDNIAFVRSEYPDVIDLFQKLPKNIMRADVIRYLLMYRLGGLYLDLDYEMLKPFDLSEYGAVLPLESEDPADPMKHRLGNSIFASAPGHPFFKAIIDELKANPPLAEDSDVEASTGPGLVTRVYRKTLGQFPDLHTPTPKLFNPPTPRGPRQYKAIVQENVAYGIHHTHGSWREMSLPRRIKRAIGNVVYWLTG